MGRGGGEFHSVVHIGTRYSQLPNKLPHGVNLPSILKVHLLRIRPERLLENPGVVALLEHKEVNPSLVLKLDSLGVCVSVEGVHQYKRHVASMLLVHVLQLE